MTIRRCVVLPLLLFGLLVGDAARFAAPAAASLRSIIDRLRYRGIDATDRPAAAATTGTTTASQLNFRSGIWGEILDMLPRGAAVTVLGKRDGWYNVKLSDGRTGWVSGKYLDVRSGTAGATPGGSTQPGTGATMRVKTTGYFPPPPGGYSSKAEARMEGGALDCRGKKLRTLQDYNAEDSSDYVSCATDPRVIKTGTYFTIDQYPGVRFLACDVGGGIKGAHIDICVKDKTASYKVTGTATIRFIR